MSTLNSFRTLLRRPQPSDLPDLQTLEMDAQVMKFTPMRIPQTESQTRLRLSGQIERQASLEPYGVWLAHLKSNNSLLGWFMLMPTENAGLEIGFMIASRFWNQGYTTEVAGTLIQHARALSQFNILIAKTDADNEASIRTLEKLGFAYVETKIVPERYFPGELPIKIFEINLRT